MSASISTLSKIIIDGQEIEIDGAATILQACEAAGAEIPRFCYHERLSVAGNCRMCLVEWQGAPKLQASCALSVADLPCKPDGSPPEILTNSEKVRKGRHGVMEFLLLNHPLDCPVCDQGGECDLQDQAMGYGFDRSRYDFAKRAVAEKDMGPLIKTVMTRCIHCTRCVRFASEIAGAPEIGAIGRGENMEIIAYIAGAVHSELSGNMIDLCPVGALTAKPYAFRARPWELTKTETIDVMDATGANIRIDSRDGAVMRILPRLHEEINEEWISDKTRFIWDGLKRQRLDRPYIRRKGKLSPGEWDEALAMIAQSLQKAQGGECAAIAGDLCDVESLYLLKKIFTRLGSAHIDCRQDGAFADVNARASYLFNPTIAGLESADLLLLVGCNPRSEAPLVNARIRKAWLAGGMRIGVIGERMDLNYQYRYLGSDAGILSALAAGEGQFARYLSRAKRPAIIIGQGALARPDGAFILRLAMQLCEQYGAILPAQNGATDTIIDSSAPDSWNGLGVLSHAASRIGGLDIGFVPGENGFAARQILAAAGQGKIKLLWLLGADEINLGDLQKDACRENCLVIYQGSHGDQGAHAADIILPAAAWSEKDALYVNLEGRPQLAQRAAFAPGQACEEWVILNKMIQMLGGEGFADLPALRAEIFSLFPHLGAIDEITKAQWHGPITIPDGQPNQPHRAPLSSPIASFYQTNPIARASTVMAELAGLHQSPTQKKQAS